MCTKECNDPNFIFDATIMENKEVYDLVKNGLNSKPQRVVNKRQIHICNKCFKKNIEKLLK